MTDVCLNCVPPPHPHGPMFLAFVLGLQPIILLYFPLDTFGLRCAFPICTHGMNVCVCVCMCVLVCVGAQPRGIYARLFPIRIQRFSPVLPTWPKGLAKAKATAPSCVQIGEVCSGEVGCWKGWTLSYQHARRRREAETSCRRLNWNLLFCFVVHVCVRGVPLSTFRTLRENAPLANKSIANIFNIQLHF